MLKIPTYTHIVKVLIMNYVNENNLPITQYIYILCKSKYKNLWNKILYQNVLPHYTRKCVKYIVCGYCIYKIDWFFYLIFEILLYWIEILIPNFELNISIYGRYYGFLFSLIFWINFSLQISLSWLAITYWPLVFSILV